ncbi:Phosphomethylpyrimidine synthase [Streptomyces californicus]
MTTSDARTPASKQNDEAGKRIGWHKGYVQGSRPDLRVPVGSTSFTSGEDVTLYDTSGPYTDPGVETDVRRGLAPLRENWIIARGDTEEYAGRPPARRTTGNKHTSPRGGLRNLDAVFPGRPRQPRRSRDGRPVTQLAYARRGEITPEMEYVAIRENVEPEVVRRDRGGPGGAAGQRQPPRDRADDHRQADPGEGERQHRQLGRDVLHRGGGGQDDLGDPVGRRTRSWTCPPAATSTPPASGCCATPPCRSAPSRSTRPWRRWTAGPRSSPGRSTRTPSSNRPNRAWTT